MIKTLAAIAASGAMLIGFNTTAPRQTSATNDIEAVTAKQDTARQHGKRHQKDGDKAKKGGQRPPKDSLNGKGKGPKMNGERPELPDSIKGKGPKPPKDGKNGAQKQGKQSRQQTKNSK